MNEEVSGVHDAAQPENNVPGCLPLWICQCHRAAEAVPWRSSDSSLLFSSSMSHALWQIPSSTLSTKLLHIGPSRFRDRDPLWHMRLEDSRQTRIFSQVICKACFLSSTVTVLWDNHLHLFGH